MFYLSKKKLNIAEQLLSFLEAFGGEKIIREKAFTSIKDVKKVLKTPMKDLDKLVSQGEKKLKTLNKAMDADFTQKVRESIRK